MTLAERFSVVGVDIFEAPIELVRELIPTAKFIRCQLA